MSRSSQGGALPMTADQQTAPISARPRSTRREPSVVIARAQPATLWVPLLAAAIHWLIVQLTATLAQRFGEANDQSLALQIPVEPHSGWLSHQLVDPLRNWDGLWYRLIAIEGYDLHSAQAAFWPLFPWTMRAVSKLTGMSVDVAGYLIANICFVVALVLLYRLVCLDFDERVARVTVWAIALFPTAVFFSAVYTESPFLMLMVGSLYAARRGNWWVAGIVGALAALTRSYGVFLVAPLAVLLIQENGFHLRRLFPKGLAIGIPLLGPAAFTISLEHTWSNKWTADWLERKWTQAYKEPTTFLKEALNWPRQDHLWISVQEQWNRFSAKPWETLRWGFSSSPEGRTIRQTEHSHYDGAYWGWVRDLIDNPTWSTIVSNAWRRDVAESDILELVCTLLFIGLALIGLWKLPIYMSVYLLPGLIVPLFQPSSVHVLMSMPRFGLTLFPLFIVIGILLAGRPRLYRPLALLSTALLILLTIQFSTWYWVS